MVPTRNAVCIFFQWKTSHFWLLRMLQISETSEIWLYEPTAIKDTRIANIWKEALFLSTETPYFPHETPFLLTGLIYLLNFQLQILFLACWLVQHNRLSAHFPRYHIWKLIVKCCQKKFRGKLNLELFERSEFYDNTTIIPLALVGCACL